MQTRLNPFVATFCHAGYGPLVGYAISFALALATAVACHS